MATKYPVFNKQVAWTDHHTQRASKSACEFSAYFKVPSSETLSWNNIMKIQESNGFSPLFYLPHFLAITATMCAYANWSRMWMEATWKRKQISHPLSPITSAHPRKESSSLRLSVAAQEHKGLSADVLSNSCVQVQEAGRPPTGSKWPTHKRQNPCDSPLCLPAPFCLQRHVVSQEQSFRLNPVHHLALWAYSGQLGHWYSSCHISQVCCHNNMTRWKWRDRWRW